MNLELSIPLDEEGFIEMECDFCKNRFMLHESVFEDETYYHFFCPICGMPADTGSFYCEEVIEAAERLVMNYALDEIQRQLGPTIREINRSGFLKMEMTVPKKEPSKELFKPLREYKCIHKNCCGLDVKVSEFDAEIGTYCPACGGAE